MFLKNHIATFFLSSQFCLKEEEVTVKAAAAFPLLASRFSTESYCSPRTCPFCQECREGVERCPSEVKIKLVDEI